MIRGILCYKDYQLINSRLMLSRYSSNSFAVFLGLYNSMTTLMALDGPTHLAEELPSPKIIMPRILIITIVSQAVLGVAWIIVLGFSIGDLQSIIHTSTG